MDHEIEVEVFRAGDYGPRGAYSEDDLARIAADYAPESHEAPVTIDHRQEGPALGWVRSLRRAGNLLLARLGGLNAEFLEQLRTGAFKKRSVELYRAADWTGRPYLRSLTFLGACPPAVKGLADPVFADTADGAWIEFEEDTSPEAGEVSPEAGDRRPEESAVTASEMTAPPDASPNSFADFTADAEATRFCEQLRNEGRALPMWAERGIERFLSTLDDATPIAFSESEGAAPQTARAWLQDFLRSLPALVPMGEAAPQSPACRFPSEPVGIAERYGARVDPESLSLHQRVMRYLEAYPHAAYSEALRAVAVG